MRNLSQSRKEEEREPERPSREPTACCEASPSSAVCVSSGWTWTFPTELEHWTASTTSSSKPLQLRLLYLRFKPYVYSMYDHKWPLCTLIINPLRSPALLLRSARSTLSSNPPADKPDSLGHRVGQTNSLPRAIPWHLNRISVEQQVKTTNIESLIRKTGENNSKVRSRNNIIIIIISFI